MDTQDLNPIDIDSSKLIQPHPEVDAKLARLLSSHATQSEKTSWKRKLQNLNTIVNDEIDPLNSEIATLSVMLEDAVGRVKQIREDMVDTCIHPIEFLVPQPDGSFVCKFCERRMKVRDVGNQNT